MLKLCGGDDQPEFGIGESLFEAFSEKRNATGTKEKIEIDKDDFNDLASSTSSKIEAKNIKSSERYFYEPKADLTKKDIPKKAIGRTVSKVEMKKY
ncbi:7151_t:CDS:2 [Dentiscutata erythropus]|uniref:7151_t:CDS:1 n=1 Tax=Dentiscutata erythropus TaxID=1348616 RepID=A0A9N9EG66_9GLOM|nr:7151_t:CDS:2 [Dentiscutata erythropus]